MPLAFVGLLSLKLKHLKFGGSNQGSTALEARRSFIACVQFWELVDPP